LWQKPSSGPLPLYGTSMSPLVDRGLVVVHVGGHDKGALTAYDANTGDVKWSWTGDGPSYASPLAADVDGVRQIITLTQDNVIGVSAADGRLLWRRPYKTEYTQNIINPILVGNTLIIAGYQNPTMAVRLVRKGDQWTTENAWENAGVSLYMSNGVLVGDMLFGLSHRNRGEYFLLDIKSGKTVWTGMPRQAENAAIIRAGTIVVSLEDDAELMVGRVSAGKFQELKRYTVANSATWAQPVVSGNRILIKDVSSLSLWTIN
jgi:outer membrane protein assembly factor BamB